MARYRWTRLDTALVLVVVLLIVPGLYRAFRPRPPEPEPESVLAETRPSALPMPVSVDVAERTPITYETIPEDRMITPRWESESEHMAVVYAQADEMRRYAAQAEPDDPFAMTEEEIQAFEKAAPLLW